MDLSSGYPFFLIKNGLPFNYEKLETDLNTEVVIMGGGISGALTAYHLINAGIECVVLDGRTIGLGSTSASTSLLQYEIDIPLYRLQKLIGEKQATKAYELCADAIGELGKIAGKIKDNSFEMKNSLYYAAYKKDITFLGKEFKARKEAGFKVEYLQQNNIEEEYGFNAPAAILSRHGAQMDAYSFTHSLHQYSKAKGLKVFDRTTVTDIRHQKNGITVKTAGGFVVKAKKLVYATGYEVVNFIDKKIVDLHSTYAIISEQMNNDDLLWKDKVLIWNTADPYLYMRTTSGNRIIIGGRDEVFYNPTRRDKLISKKSKQLVQDFKKIFPGIPFQREFSWTGTFGSTSDGLPFIGSYDKLPNSYFALGFGGNGITFSLIAAQIIRDLIMQKSNENTVLFSFKRA